jgi:NTE family protein
MLSRFLMGQPGLQSLFSVFEYMGLYDDRPLLDWLAARFNANSGGRDWASMGLADLYNTTGRSLTVIASDITDPTMLVLNHSTAPDLPLRWAVRMTIGVPYLMPPVTWQPEWGLYRQRKIDNHLIVDGGLLSQFPIELFLSSNEDVQAIMGSRMTEDNILGLLLDESRPVPGYQPPSVPNKRRFEVIPGLRLTRLLLDTLITNARSTNADTLKSHVIQLPVLGVNPFDFTVGQAELQSVINSAYNITHTFLTGWEHLDPRTMLTSFEKRYVQVIAEKFIVSGDYYQTGDIINSTGIAIGRESESTVSRPVQDGR